MQYPDSSAPPPPFKPTREPGVVESRGGGGFIIVFGLPFLLAGLFFLQMPLGLLPMDSDGSGWPDALTPLFGLPFFIIGVIMVFGRRGITIDTRTQTILHWYGLIVPLRRSSHFFGEVCYVRLEHEEGDSETPESWPVHIHFSATTRPLHVTSAAKLNDGLAVAQFLSRTLGHPLEDISSGARVVRDPDRLEETLREAAAKGADALPVPDGPAAGFAELSDTAEALVVFRPPRQPSRPHLIPLAFAVLFAGGIGIFFVPWFLSQDGPRLLILGVAGFAGLFLGLAPVWAALVYYWRTGKKWWRMTVTDETVRFQDFDGKRQRVTEIPAARVCDLLMPTMQDKMEAAASSARANAPAVQAYAHRYQTGQLPGWSQALWRLAPSSGIIIRGAGAEITFGKDLPVTELPRIRALVHNRIVQGK